MSYLAYKTLDSGARATFSLFHLAMVIVFALACFVIVISMVLLYALIRLVRFLLILAEVID